MQLQFPRPALIFYGSITRIATVTAIAVGLSSPLTALAMEQNEERAPATSWSLGLGGISKQKPYTDIDRDNSALPLLQFENKYFRIFGPEI